ncbi:MAG TPA: hypothetical protein PKH39_11735 [Woeseiaceae bacterium]|nr:hypothetical protein [Woeseiaceae bacterium]
MAKRTFAALITLSVLVLSGVTAEAQLKPVAVDGCAKLARVIYSEVSAAALYGPARGGPWTIDLGQGDLEVCEHAARTVTRAFTAAMQVAGIGVSWGPDRNQNGDFCWSGFISQCYPNRDRVDYLSRGPDAEFVTRAWATVSHTVMREMYNPFSSDEIRFRDDDLKLRLGLALRSVGRDSH